MAFFVVVGTRQLGRVDEYAGEWAETRFFHFCFLPIVPLSSSWVRGYGVQPQYRHPTKLNARSVASAYLRAWPAFVAFLLFAFPLRGHLGALLGALAAAVIAIGAWRTRSLRDPLAKRRADFHRAAYGTRCDPTLWRTDRVAQARARLEGEWPSVGGDSSPNEVARLGPTSPRQAIIAYGLLGLAALEVNARGNAAHAAAESILTDDAVSSVALVEEADAHDPIVRAQGCALVEVLRRRARKQALALLLVGTPFAAGGVYNIVRALMPVTTYTTATVDASAYGQDGRLDCSAIDAGWTLTDAAGAVTRTIAVCEVGGRYVPVVFAGDPSKLPSVVTGSLHALIDIDASLRSAMQSDPVYGVLLADFYVDATHPGRRTEEAPGAVLIVGTVTALWILWFRARRRRRAIAS